MDMSLEDVILRNLRKKQPGKRKGQNGFKLGVQKGGIRKGKAGLIKNGKGNDARLKIVQNQRKKYRDARDKLVAINKMKGDARQKIEKLRGEKMQHQPISNAGRINVQRSMDGRLHLTTQKSRMLAASAQLSPRKLSRPLRITHPLYKELEPRIEQVPDYGARAYSGALRRTIDNRTLDYGYPIAESVRQSHLWTQPSPMVYRSPSEDIKPIPAIVTRRSEMTSWPRNYQEPSTFSQRSDPYAANRLRMDQESESMRMLNVHSRLDRPNSYQRPQLPPVPSEEEGFRIVVSNLHSSVTSIDIKELFEDVGELLVWRVVRPGTAEVVYKRHDQAVKAVEVYHNRLLDGLPMKCMLVNPLKMSNGRQQKILQASGGIKSSSRPDLDSVQPDLDAVRKALFGRPIESTEIFKRHNL